MGTRQQSNSKDVKKKNDKGERKRDKGRGSSNVSGANIQPRRHAMREREKGKRSEGKWETSLRMLISESVTQLFVLIMYISEVREKEKKDERATNV